MKLGQQMGCLLYTSNIETPTVQIELADSTRAGVFKPVYDDEQRSTTLMLLMNYENKAADWRPF